MLAYDSMVLGLLIISAFCLCIFLLMLLAVFFASEKRFYYRRVQIKLPEAEKRRSTLGKGLSTALRVIGALVAIGLLAFLAISLIRFISSSSGTILDGGLPENYTSNTSGIVNETGSAEEEIVQEEIQPETQLNLSGVNAEIQEGYEEYNESFVEGNLSAIDRLRDAVSDYWIYVLAGFVLLAIIILVLGRVESSPSD